MTASLPQLVRAEDLAGYLQLKPETVVKKCRSGKFPAVKIGLHWFVNVARLAEYIDRATLVVPRDPPIPPADDVSHPVTGTTEFKGRYLPGDATARASSPPARAVAGWDVHEKETT